MTVSCDSIRNLKAEVLAANAGIPQIGLGFGGRYETSAIEQISETTQQLATQLDGKCEQYNSCVIDADTWLAEERRLRDHVESVTKLKAAPTAANGMALWQSARPDLAANGLSLKYQVQARPKGASAFGEHRSGHSDG